MDKNNTEMLTVEGTFFIKKFSNIKQYVDIFYPQYQLRRLT